MKNKDLKTIYDNVYENGEENFFTFSAFELHNQVINLDLYYDKRVLDVGCGSGDVARGIVRKGAKSVLAIDYSKVAIDQAKVKNGHEKIIFEVKSFEDIAEKFDVITLVGVLEHIENPFGVVEYLQNLLFEDGKLIFECPSFLNIRGYVWMTLQLLFNVPMSLTDINFLSPFDFAVYANKLNMNFEWKTFDYSRGNGERMIEDLGKRLTNALKDAGLDNKNVPALIEWLKQASKYDNKLKHSGAEAIYILSNRSIKII